MNKFSAACLSLGLLSMAACHSTNSVELFRVNQNGEVVNIGRGADAEHVIYGHFRETDTYDRAALTVQNPDTHNAVCYINVNDGQTSHSVGVGIRIDSCSKASLLNEGMIFDNLDQIAVFDQSNLPWGTYRLYRYHDDHFSEVLTRPIHIDHWQEGIDALRVDPDQRTQVVLTYSVTANDGSPARVQETVAIDAILNGTANIPATNSNANDETTVNAADNTATNAEADAAATNDDAPDISETHPEVNPTPTL